MKLGLAALFALTALLYASVGFGGGSTYTALLVLGGADFRAVPVVALLCNITVVAGGTWRFARAEALPARRLAPFLAASIPAAWAGGRLPVEERAFVGLLGAALLVAGARMAVQALRRRRRARGQMEVGVEATRDVPTGVALGTGAALGGLAGVVGIGGGIFLAPVLYALRWGGEREIAGACSLFILLNSVAGLAGQLQKGGGDALGLAAPYFLLIPAVLVGGQIGSWLGSSRLRAEWVRGLTALLILYVATRLLLRWAAG